MIDAVGGTHGLIGTGEAEPGARLHRDCYVFDDRIIPVSQRRRTSLVDYARPVAKEF